MEFYYGDLTAVHQDTVCSRGLSVQDDLSPPKLWRIIFVMLAQNFLWGICVSCTGLAVNTHKGSCDEVINVQFFFLMWMISIFLGRPRSPHFLLHWTQRLSAAAAPHQGAPRGVGLQHFQPRGHDESPHSGLCPRWVLCHWTSLGQRLHEHSTFTSASQIINMILCTCSAQHRPPRRLLCINVVHQELASKLVLFQVVEILATFHQLLSTSSITGTSPHAASSMSVSPGVKQANISWEAGFDGGSAQTFSVWWV